MSTSAYEYESLSEREIRYVRVQKSLATSQLSCSITPIERYYTNTGRGNDYTALSYTWGDSTSRYGVLLNPWDRPDLKRTHLVSQNLFDFLEAYITHPWGLQRKKRWLWIDQICINQEDFAERSVQVSMMNTIFREARTVLVWLGSDPVMVDAARRLRDDGPDRDEAFATLARHPYFTRLWVVQEVALAAKIDVVCGEVELKWLCLEEAAKRVYNTQWETGPPAPARAIILESQLSHTLERCISLYCGNQCHDPRDKIYGLLGTTSERWRVPVDYTKTVTNVYLDVVAALYEELFDILDPACHYSRDIQQDSAALGYRVTAFALGQAMGLSQEQMGGLYPFLERLQESFLNTSVRNISYTYTGPQGRQILNASRRNPFLRDVVPAIGWQQAEAPEHDGTLGQSHISVSSSGRWWYDYQGTRWVFVDETTLLEYSQAVRARAILAAQTRIRSLP